MSAKPLSLTAVTAFCYRMINFCFHRDCNHLLQFLLMQQLQSSFFVYSFGRLGSGRKYLFIVSSNCYVLFLCMCTAALEAAVQHINLKDAVTTDCVSCIAVTAHYCHCCYV